MRTERDSFGNAKVPSEAYYGVFTQRSINNFPVSGNRFQKELIWAYAAIKGSAAMANSKLGRLNPKIAKAIVKASNEVLMGKHSGQFPIDVFQAGAGTSTNMNVNEVIANRALEILGHKRGNYEIINPNDHVNMSQSTNDTFESATQMAAYHLIVTKLIPSLEEYQNAIRKKSKEFSGVVKSGRTHLMDAVPIRLGQEFSGYSIDQEINEIKGSSEGLLYLNSGGTAVGTGINTSPKFKKLFFKEVNRITGYNFKPSRNLFASTQNITTIAEASSRLRNLCLKLLKASNDIRLMSSGPYAGINEITLPEVQPGSSIMPGKVNPSMAEMLGMVCFKVMGNDETIALAAQAGQFELNVFSPVAAYCLLEEIEILANGVRLFTEKCLYGIKPNATQMNYYFEHSAAVATALSPRLGYSETAKLVKEAVKRNISVRNLVLEKKLLARKELDELLSPSKLTKPNL